MTCCTASTLRRTAEDNVVITVSFKGESFNFALEGSELSTSTMRDGSDGPRYLGNASKDFITEQIESGLVAMFLDRPLP